MDLGMLETFATEAREELMRTVSGKIDHALRADGPVRRANPQAVAQLEKAMAANGRETVVETTAYTWFNRFCALRFMDVNGYTDSGVVSPSPGGTIPGILAEARDGNFDPGIDGSPVAERVRQILSGAMREDDPNSAAYRVLFVAACNAWNAKMPFLFEKIGDWTEILLPDDLLSPNSILASVREALSPEVCADVEVVGWLYQFYVAKKKAEIEDGFKRNVKAAAEDIPAVTQLFTPHWIVKYLVQNSLGRLWMRLHPDSTLASQMEYLVPDDPAHQVPLPSGIECPEDIKICDPCCGSAHMLTYAFDIMCLIYEECGYAPAEIPGLILKHNLFGLELDSRAAALSSFALAMKARGRYSRFFRNPVQPNICAIEPVQFTPDEKKAYMDRLGRDLFTEPLLLTLDQFEEADNLGSLIVPALRDAAGMESVFGARDIGGDLFLQSTHRKVLKVLREAAYLSPRYHVVVTNPPYLGAKNMNGGLKAFAEECYPMSKADMFAMFIERCFELCVPSGMVSMVTMQSWMFLSSFEQLRRWLLDEKTVLSMAHLGARAFDTIGGEVVSTTAFAMCNSHVPNYRGGYLRLVDVAGEAGKSELFLETMAERSREGRV